MAAAVYIDDDSEQMYYLAFDFPLARVPIRDAVAYIQEGGAVESEPDDPVGTARHAAIRAALLDATLGNSGPAWDPMLKREHAKAAKLAAKAGLHGRRCPLALPSRISP
jgi:hypothetical protein